MWTEPICTKCVRSRGEGDCSIVALVSLLGVSYEDVLSVCSGLTVFPHREGMYNSQIKKAAAILGVTLKRRSLVKRTLDWDNATGILDMICRQNRNGQAHVATLRHGLIFDAEQVWLPEDFIRHYRAEIRGIMEPQ